MLRLFLVSSLTVTEVNKSFPCFHFTLSGLWGAEGVGDSFIMVGVSSG